MLWGHPWDRCLLLCRAPYESNGVLMAGWSWSLSAERSRPRPWRICVSASMKREAGRIGAGALNGGAAPNRGRAGESRAQRGINRGGAATAIGRQGRQLQSSAHVSLLPGDGRATLDAQFWHFLFGFGPGSLQKICSLMYTLQIVYRD
jgi:hypothetical protein